MRKDTATRTEAVPALVLGSGVTALGVIRLLGRSGIPVYCLSDRRDFATTSRFCRGVFRVERPAGIASLTATLARLPFERALLFPCSDTWVDVVGALDGRLARRFPSTVAHDNVRLLTDKGHFAAAMRRCHIPHPRTAMIATGADLSALDEAYCAGMFLKPRHSQAFASHFGVKGFAVDSRADAMRRFDDVSRAGFDLVLQEYIPGPPCSHYFLDGFVDRTGRICGLFARRRIRMHPEPLGNTTSAVSIPLDEIRPAVEAIERLASCLPLRGIFSAEFKYDSRDGEFKIIEINARPWWFVEFAAACGVDVCTMAYRDALGLPLTGVSSYAVGKTGTFITKDLRSCRSLWRRHALSLRQWIASWRRTSPLILSWRDPLPGVWHLVAEGREILHERFHWRERAVTVPPVDRATPNAPQTRVA